MLVRGSLKAIGTVEDLLRGETPPYWEVALRGTGAEALPCGRVVSRHDDRLLVRVESRRDLHRLLSSLDRAGAVLVSVAPARRSLEDLLLQEVRGAAGGAADPAVDASGDGGGISHVG
jgi:hypothetical protein